MFNKRLKQELSALREEFSSLQQVKESLESEMLCLTLDADGRMESANRISSGNALQKEQHYRATYRRHRAGPCEAG